MPNAGRSNSPPRPVTKHEWEELADLPLVRDAYGFDNHQPGTNGERLRELAYGAHFDYVPPVYDDLVLEPGGDVYVLIDDALAGVLVIIRHPDGDLNVTRAMMGSRWSQEADWMSASQN